MKSRLDQLLIDRNLARSLTEAQAMIGAGEVYVDERIADKPGRLYPPTAVVRLKEKCPYVSRGGLKLARGLCHFHVDVRDKTCLDVGASTGGFTDCLLQHHARMVYAVDVAYGQLAWKIRQDPRVVVLERFNAKNISAHDIDNRQLDLAVMDVSFISITTLLPALVKLFTASVAIIALIKPQFELPKSSVGEGGVVSDPALHRQSIDKIIQFAERMGLTCHGVIDSPLLGPKGNHEFLISLSSSNTAPDVNAIRGV